MEETGAIERARRIHELASSMGFDWDNVRDVLAKVREETAEIEEAVADGDQDQARRELGDLLFTTVNVARFLSADAATELDAATGRFEKRFARVLDEVARRGRQMSDYTLAELDVIWEEVKRDERASAKTS